MTDITKRLDEIIPKLQNNEDRQAIGSAIAEIARLRDFNEALEREITRLNLYHFKQGTTKQELK